MQTNSKNVNPKFRSNILKAIRRTLFLSTFASVAANANLNHSGVFIDSDTVRYRVQNGEATVDQRSYSRLLYRNVVCVDGFVAKTVAVMTGRTAEDASRHEIQVHWQGPAHVFIGSGKCCIEKNTTRLGAYTFENHRFSDGVTFEYEDAGDPRTIIIEKRCFFHAYMPSICIPERINITMMESVFEHAEIPLITFNCKINVLPPRLFKYVHSERIVINSSISVIGEECFFGKEFDATEFLREHQHQITHIGKCAFTNNPVSHYTGAPTLQSIDDQAFDCSGLTMVDLSQCLNVSFGDKVFLYCGRLSSVVFPPNIISITECMFYYCRSLISIDLPDSVLSLQHSCFCVSGLQKLRLPPRLLSIDIAALMSTDIIHLIIPASVLYIGICAVYDVPTIRMERSYLTRYFNHDMLFGTNVRRHYAAPETVENAFVVSEVPLSDLINEECFENLANTLDEAEVQSYSVLVRWSFGTDVFDNCIFTLSVNGITEHLRSRLASTKSNKYVCVPGTNDIKMFDHLKDGRLHVMPAGSPPIAQIIEDQYRQAQLQIEDANFQFIANALAQSLIEGVLVQLVKDTMPNCEYLVNY
ncbi:MAG: leucine-rich repeat domain-containing protein [Holosporales bacterium]|nr:leucine-rich repeat domain-containing protein [Holosporales bacterium]